MPLYAPSITAVSSAMERTMPIIVTSVLDRLVLRHLLVYFLKISISCPRPASGPAAPYAFVPYYAAVFYCNDAVRLKRYVLVVGYDYQSLTVLFI